MSDELRTQALTVLQQRMVAASWKAFRDSLAGRELLEVLNKLESRALHAIEDCSDYRESTELVIRYQQRKAVCQYLRAHIDNHIESLGGELHDAGTDPESDNTDYTPGSHAPDTLYP